MVGHSTCHPHTSTHIGMHAWPHHKPPTVPCTHSWYPVVLQVLGFSPELAYSLAVCQYRQRDFPAALATISEIVELGVHAHPELGVGSAADGLEASPVAFVPGLPIAHTPLAPLGNTMNGGC